MPAWWYTHVSKKTLSEQQLVERRLAQVLGDAAEPAPVVGDGAAAVRDDQPQGGEVGAAGPTSGAA